MDSTDSDVTGQRAPASQRPRGKKREIVLPGDLLDEGGLRGGSGTFVKDKKVYSAIVGIKSVRSNFVNVIPLSGKYFPRVGDNVIGTINQISNSSWMVDIGGPYPAMLHSTDTPWRIDFGDTARYLNVGDTVLAVVSRLDDAKKLNISLRDRGLRRLSGGQTVMITSSKVPRVIGKGGSMISMIKNYTGCRIFVGQNGVIWLDGSRSSVEIAMEAIRMIDAKSQMSGLTNAVNELLEQKKGQIPAPQAPIAAAPAAKQEEPAKKEEDQIKTEEKLVEDLERENKENIDETRDDMTQKED